ncbi:hypothetical protein [Nocardioides sp. TF02-7]|uniref:hypothetical protein n=1 Tax=Nocardioides sp. TF02-7 TaxID=2917724 RepID=UPI001F06B6F6|nr:hypothetical protein [Nocardioides sp. TF02-7]UMG94037.1 hypothetical protein MF408_08250 [Nocardioides sp. TF02-7]
MEDLLALVFDDPATAQRRAEQLLASSPAPLGRSYAHQCLGIVHREAGRLPAAIDHLRSALRAARATGDAERVRDVRATYGATLVVAGRTRAGIAQLDRALDGASGEVGSQVLMRKAAVLALLGRHEQAAPLMRQALDELSGAGSPVWRARTMVWLAHVEQRLGHLDAAEREVLAAERIFEEEGATLERLTALENRAAVAVARGDLATGLRLHGLALAGYREAGQVPRFEAVGYYASTYLAAGLADEAVGLLDRFAGEMALPPLEEAEFELPRRLGAAGCG